MIRATAVVASLIVTVRLRRPGALSVGTVTLRPQLADPRGHVIGDAAEHIGEPGLRVDAIELRCLDQGVG